MIANVGCLVVPVTKAAVLNRTAQLPISLFAHNVQTVAAATLVAQDYGEPTGVVGRMQLALEAQATAYRTTLWSLSGTKRMLAGSRPPYAISRDAGVVSWQVGSARTHATGPNQRNPALEPNPRHGRSARPSWAATSNRCSATSTARRLQRPCRTASHRLSRPRASSPLS